MTERTFSRRTFIKAAGVGAGIAIASGYSPFTYAANERVRVGCIGTGGQGTFHLRDGLAGVPEIEVVAVADVYRPHQEPAVKFGQLANAGIAFAPGMTLSSEQKAQAEAARQPSAYFDYRQMLATEELDAVVIATPLDTHHQIVMDCLNAGKWAFCEKTLADSVEQCREIVTKAAETQRFVQVGHQRRYNPKYNLAMKIVHEGGDLGRIAHISAHWHRNNYWRRPLPDGYVLSAEEAPFIPDLERHLNWRLYKERSGGLFTELAAHQTDVANWFLRSVPARVYASGGIDYWRDGRTVDDNIAITYEYDIAPGQDGFMPLDARSRYQKLNLINKPYTVRFTYSSTLMNAKRGASEMIHGDYATLEMTEGPCWIYGEPGARVNQEPEKKDASSAAADVTSGATLKVSTEALNRGIELLADGLPKTPDVLQFEAFAKHIREGGVPRSNQMAGLTAAITAIAALQSREEGRVVEIDPAWYAFDFEVPPFAAYEFQWDKEWKPDWEKEGAAPASAPATPAPEA